MSWTRPISGPTQPWWAAEREMVKAELEKLRTKAEAWSDLHHVVDHIDHIIGIMEDNG